MNQNSDDKWRGYVYVFKYIADNSWNIIGKFKDNDNHGEFGISVCLNKRVSDCNRKY